MMAIRASTLQMPSIQNRQALEDAIARVDNSVLVLGSHAQQECLVWQGETGMAQSPVLAVVRK
jgi:hypothetical protein